MLKVKVNYEQYTKPGDYGWLDFYLFLKSLIPGYSSQKKKKSFILDLEYPESFLIKNKTFSVFGSMLESKEAAEFEILNWKYRINGQAEAEVDLSVREIGPKPIEIIFRKLSWELQVAFAALVILLPIVGGVIIYYSIINFPEPSGLWEFVGKYIRGFVGFSLFILMLVALIWSQRRFSKSSIASTILGSIFGLLITLLPILWILLTARPKEIVGQPQEHILYLIYLKTHAASIFLVFVGIIPWLTIFLKYFGYDLLVSILNKIPQSAEK